MGQRQLLPRPRILLVDDEPLLLKALRRSLERDYDVTCAGDGELALELVMSDSTFAAIVCDLRMPGMGGEELYTAIVKEAPDLAPRMIFISGETWSPGTKRFLDAVPNARFEKPVDIRDLRASIQAQTRP